MQIIGPDPEPTVTLNRAIDRNPLADVSAEKLSSKTFGKRQLTSDTAARPQIALISREENFDFATHLTEYKYDDSAGTGVTIYIIDSGANPDHPVCAP
jgi:subtilisin family serine protease